MKRFCYLLLVSIFIFSFSGCPDPGGVSPELIEYGYSVLFFVSLMTITAPTEEAIAVETVGDTITYTFTSFPYSDTDTDAVVNGTMIMINDGVTYTETADFTFSNDDIGLETIEEDASGTSDGDLSGTVTINGSVQDYQDFIDYINSLISKK